MKIKKAIKKTGKIISAPVRKPYKHFKHKKQQKKLEKDLEHEVANLYKDPDFVEGLNKTIKDFYNSFSAVVAEEDPVIVDVE